MTDFWTAHDYTISPVQQSWNLTTNSFKILQVIQKGKWEQDCEILQFRSQNEIWIKVITTIRWNLSRRRNIHLHGLHPHHQKYHHLQSPKPQQFQQEIYPIIHSKQSHKMVKVVCKIVGWVLRLILNTFVVHQITTRFKPQCFTLEWLKKFGSLIIVNLEC